MQYSEQFLSPYFDIGTGHETERHLSTLEMIDEQLDAFSDSEHRSLQGSILSEMVDIYSRPESSDTDRAEAALDKSDVMYRSAAESEERFPLARRELIFNDLRRARTAGTMATALRPTLRQLTALARHVAAGEYLATSGETVGFNSEMLGFAVPLWATLERAEAIDSSRSLIGWPSYVRQDRAPISTVRLPNGKMEMPPRRSFDIRLSAYDEDWAEVIGERKKIQIKSRKVKRLYEDDIIVIPVWKIGRITHPSQAVSLAISFGRYPSKLHEQRASKVQGFAGGFMDNIDLDSRAELVTA
jgi:hypothetical protein